MLGELLYSGQLTFESDAEFLSQIEHFRGRKVPGAAMDRWIVYGCDDDGRPTVTFFSRIVGASEPKFTFVEYLIKRREASGSFENAAETSIDSSP